MARVLFLTQVLPYPLDSGARIRAYYVLRHLAARHEVTLVSFVRPDDRPEHTAHLEAICRAVHTVPMRRSRLRDARALVLGFITRWPMVIVRDEIGEMHSRLRRLVEETAFDVVHADQTSMAQYALCARQAQRRAGQPPARLILDAHNALYRIPERMARHERNPLKRLLWQREARALRRYEADLSRTFDQVVFVAPEDRAALLPSNFQHPTSNIQLPTSNFQIIPICVDPRQKPIIPLVPRPHAVTHLGTMFWLPNVEGMLWFAREVWPGVQAQVPEARLVIIGKNPPQEIRDLPVADPRIEVTGYVADPAPYLAETAAFIVPVRAAGGMRVKIVDAWCWGLPIVSTTIGAEGIDYREGENILIADSPAAFAQAVVRTLQDEALARRLRENGRQWVKERYDWCTVYHQWDAVYTETTPAPAAAGTP